MHRTRYGCIGALHSLTFVLVPRLISDDRDGVSTFYEVSDEVDGVGLHASNSGGEFCKNEQDSWFGQAVVPGWLWLIIRHVTETSKVIDSSPH